MRKIYPEGEVEAEIQNLRESTEMEITEVEAGEGWVSLGKMLKITCEERFICWDGHSHFPTVCGHQHSHVLQPHHSSVIWFCLQSGSNASVTHHSRGKCIWFHSEHILS